MGNLLEDRSREMPRVFTRVRDENILMQPLREVNREEKRLREKIRVRQQLRERASRPRRILLPHYSLSTSFWISDLREKRPIPELRTSTRSAVSCLGTVRFVSHSTRSLLRPTEHPHHAAPVDPNKADYFKAELDLKTSTQQKMCNNTKRLDVKKAGTSMTYILSEKEIKNASFERDTHGNQNISTEPKKVALIQLRHSVFLNLMKILFTTIYIMSFLMQVNCQICPDTLKSVSSCPLNAEEYNVKSKKCSNACQTSQNDPSNMYRYHCLRKPEKTELIEVCAVPQFMFDYCPEYDPVGKFIQMDQSTNCNSKSNLSYYISSDIFHCDVKCFHLYEKQDVVIATRIPVTNETMIPDDSEENLTGSTSTLIIILAVTGTTACIVILVCLIRILRTRRWATCPKTKTERKEIKPVFKVALIRNQRSTSA